MSPTVEEIEYWREWVGRRSSRTDTLHHSVLQRYAATIGEVYEEGGPFPSMGQAAFFLDAPQPDELGPDGHPKRGGSMPPVTLPRRMAGESETIFHKPLKVGVPATRTGEIASLTHKKGRSRDMIFVEMKSDLEQEGELCISGKHTSIYLGEADPSAPPAPVAETAPPAPSPEDEIWNPTPVDLFRFSAVTFNSHRIHYDQPYATGVEGYPGLLVHGPFTAAKLLGYARRLRGEVRRFAFRAQSPIFVGQPIVLTPGEDDRQVVARRHDGKIAMTAKFDLR